MVRTRRTARKSTGRQPIGQLVPKDVPPQQELQPNSPQEEEPFEIVVTVPTGEDSQEAQPMPQNHDHDSKRKKTMRKKNKVATRLKVKKMKIALHGAMPRRMRHSTTPTRSKLLEMKPRSPLVD
jgi:hypothetical protein